MLHIGEHSPPVASWEEAVVCGACGSGDARFSGSIGRRRFAVCRRCRIERLYDRVAETDLNLLYGTYYAADDPSPLALEQQLANPTFAHRRRRLHQFAGTRTHRILEIGCGDGNFLETLRRAGWDVHGQEVSVSTAAIVARRHGIPVSDLVVADSRPTCDGPASRTRSAVKRVMRTGVDRISSILARLEAAIARGAVVDIVAQRE